MERLASKFVPTPGGRRVFLLATAVCLPLALRVDIATAQRVAIDDLREVDADFWFLGEYLGEITTPAGTCPPGPVKIPGHPPVGRQRLGVQVRPEGEGTFRVAEYSGGLPGNGWNRQLHYAMTASRNASEDVSPNEQAPLVVDSDGYQFVIDGHRAIVRTYGGQVLGVLAKVARESPTLGAAPPPNALVLFDGTHTEHFKNGQINEQGWLQMGTELRQVFRDYFLHIEFRLPYMPHSAGQSRANSGVYLQSRYEVQVLDSFGLEGKFNECAALYRQRPPALNMCLPPLQWQTYDIEFHAPRFDDDGRKLRNARISVRHNGVYVHYQTDIVAKTGAGQAEGPQPLPIKLQNHGDPVVFRNIWLIDLAPQAVQAVAAK